MFLPWNPPVSRSPRPLFHLPYLHSPKHKVYEDELDVISPFQELTNKQTRIKWLKCKTSVCFVDTEELELVNDDVFTCLGQHKPTSPQLQPSCPQRILCNCYMPSHCASLQFQGDIGAPHFIRECVLIFITVNVFKFFTLQCCSFCNLAVNGSRLFKCLYSYVNFILVP